MDCGGKLNASMISSDLRAKYKQMKGDNLSNQMIKFYNGYCSLIWLHYVGTCVELHPRNVPTKFHQDWPSGLREEDI